MAEDVAIRELSLLRQYNSKLKGGFLPKVQQELSRICRNLENQIEKSIQEEKHVTRYSSFTIEQIKDSARKAEDLKSRHYFGSYDNNLFDMDIAQRKKTSDDLEEQLEHFKKGHQQLRAELEDTISQLKAFGEIIESQVNSASQSLKSQISVLETYKDSRL